MSHRIAYAPEAEAQLVSLYHYISQQSGSEIAHRFTEAIMAHCDKLSDYPERGRPRDDLRSGLRTMAFRRRVTIAYAVNEVEVRILGVFYGGQDLEAALHGGG